MKNPFRNLRKWLMALTIMTFSVVAFLAMSGTVFAAEGGVTSILLQDTSSPLNGKIDQVIITAIYANGTPGPSGNACTAIANGNAGDWTVTDAGTSGAVAVASVTWLSGNADLDICSFKLTLTEGANSSVNTAATAVDVVYVPGTLAVTDGISPAAVLAVTTDAVEVDGAAPVIESFSYWDTDSNGKINQITANFSETVSGASVLGANDLTFGANVGNFTGAAFGALATDLITDPVALVAIPLGTEATVIDTEENAGTIAISSQNLFSLVDTGMNVNSVGGPQSQATFVDKAAPVIKTFTYQDADVDGKIDTILVTYSEEVVTGSTFAADNLSLTNVGDFTGAVFGTGLDLVTGTVSSTSVTLGTEATVQDTNDSGSIAISTVGVLSLTDTATSPNTYSAAVAQTQATFVDGAAPAAKTVTFYDATSDDGKLDIITVVWSENISAVVDASAKWALTSAANFAAVTEGTVECNSGGAAANECDYNFTTTTVKTDVGDLSLAYTSVGDQITDGTNAIAADKTFTSASVSPIPSFTDAAKPIAVSVTLSNASNKNKIAIVYSEPIAITLDADGYVDAADLTSDESMTSTASVGGIDSAGSIERIGNFGTTGNVTQSAEVNNTLAISADGLTLTVTLNSATGAYFTAGTTEPSVSFSVDAWAGTGVDLIAQVPASADGVAAGTAQRVNSSHSVSSVVGGGTWDLTPPSTITYFRVVSFTSALTGVNLEWTAHSTLADWSRYMFAYGTSAGVGLSSSLWTSSNDENLTTITQQSTRITGLTQNSTYYTKAYAIDIEGNVSTGSTETNFTLSSYTGDSGAPTSFSGVATNFKVSINENLKTVLTWKDPVESGFDKVQIYRAKGSDPAEYSLLATVSKWLQTYTDTDVNGGEVVNYKLKAIDENGYAGEFTSVQTITIGEGEESVTTEEATIEEFDATVEEGAAEEEPPVEPITIITESGTTVTLNDVTGHWAEDEITAMTGEEIVEGDEDGNFNPNDSLNRAEAAAILYRVLGLEEPTTPEEAPFADVATDTWYAGYVANLKSLNLVSGQTETTYGPALPINRAEFLNLAMNVYHYLTGTTTPEDQVTTDAFFDLDTEAWYAPVVSEAYGLEFISGSTCTTGICFNAGDPITRAEATKILYNMFYSMLTAQTAE